MRESSQRGRKLLSRGQSSCLGFAPLMVLDQASFQKELLLPVSFRVKSSGSRAHGGQGSEFCAENVFTKLPFPMG